MLCCAVTTCAGEVGDTWIHGIGSDPGRMADYRAVLRARRECEAAAGTHCDTQVGFWEKRVHTAGAHALTQWW
jgi:hypothetical protein